MAFDPSLLLQAKGIDISSPLAMGTQAMTLGNLANQNQLGQIQVQQQQALMQAWSDPRAAQMVQSFMDPSQIGQGASLARDLATDYPKAAPQIMQGALGLMKEQTGIGLAQSETGEHLANTVTKRLGPIGNLAANIAVDPTNDMAWQNLTNTIQMTPGIAQYLGLPPNAATITDPGQRRNMSQQWASAVLDPKANADMRAIIAKTPLEVTGLQLGNAKTATEIGQMPAELAVKQQNAATESANVFGPKVEFDPFGRAVSTQRFGPNGPSIGTPSGAENQPDPISANAQAIAKYQQAPPTRPSPLAAATMDRVRQLNPDYDATTWENKSKTVNDFGTGAQGQQVKSFNVALSHLDTLNNLVDAMNNGNLQGINKWANAYQAQTGNPAPTNLDAAKQFVADEVAKGIIGGGGTGSDREKAQTAIAAQNSPAQLKGAIQTYQNIAWRSTCRTQAAI